MLNRISSYIMGQIIIRAQGGSTEKLLNICMAQCIIIKDICPITDGFTAIIPHRFLKKIREAASITDTKIIILRQKGAYLRLRPFAHRYGIILGICAVIVIAMLTKNIIWSIKFYDFTKVEIQQMRELLYDNNIYEGSVADESKLNRAERNIIHAATRYGWISLNFIHGRLIVEKTDASPRTISAQGTKQDVVAHCDGIIRRMDLSGGFLQVCEGLSVAKGDILVKSTYTDVSGNTISTSVMAKIYAEVEKTYELTLPLSYSILSPQSDKKSYYSLLLCDKEYKLYDDKHINTNAKESIIRYPLELCGFALPCTVQEYEVREQRETEVQLTQEQALAIARIKTLDAIKADLPEVELLATSETSNYEENQLLYKLKIRAEANIAEIVQTSS